MIENFYRQFIRWGYIIGMLFLIGSLPHSKFGLSVSQFVLAGAFILEGLDLKKIKDYFASDKNLLLKYILLIPYLVYLTGTNILKKFNRFFRNKPAVIFASLFVLHILGLFFTTNFDYAMKDLRTKVPLFILPLFISTSEAFTKKQFYWIMLFFIGSLLGRTFINTWYLVFHQYIDIRDISKPISHIILSLEISFAFFIIGYLVFRVREIQTGLKIIISMIFLWFIVFLIISKSLTGIIITVSTFFLLSIIFIFLSRNFWMKAGLSLLLLILFGGAILYLFHVDREYHHVNPVDFSHLDQYTARGNKYSHQVTSKMTENGNYVYLYIQWEELREAWNRKSRISYDSLDNKKQKIVNTLIRFLTSKGFRKDEDGVNKLTDEEIHAIENGTANVIFMKKLSIRGTLYELIGGYEKWRKTGDPTGSSLMQRFEFWKASAGLIRENWLTGVGTGDMNVAFQKQYEIMNTRLSPDQRWRSHNQFLSVFVAFGILGFCWFLVTIIYPAIKTGGYSDFFFLAFFIIAMFSMLPEDTIESQAGVTFYAFFYSFLLFGRKEMDLFKGRTPRS